MKYLQSTGKKKISRKYFNVIIFLQQFYVTKNITVVSFVTTRTNNFLKGHHMHYSSILQIRCQKLFPDQIFLFLPHFLPPNFTSPHSSVVVYRSQILPTIKKLFKQNIYSTYIKVKCNYIIKLCATLWCPSIRFMNERWNFIHFIFANFYQPICNIIHDYLILPEKAKK